MNLLGNNTITHKNFFFPNVTAIALVFVILLSSIAAGDDTDNTQSAGDVMTSLSLWHHATADDTQTEWRTQQWIHYLPQFTMWSWKLLQALHANQVRTQRHILIKIIIQTVIQQMHAANKHKWNKQKSHHYNTYIFLVTFICATMFAIWVKVSTCTLITNGIKSSSPIQNRCCFMVLVTYLPAHCKDGDVTQRWQVLQASQVVVQYLEILQKACQPDIRSFCIILQLAALVSAQYE